MLGLRGERGRRGCDERATRAAKSVPIAALVAMLAVPSLGAESAPPTTPNAYAVAAGGSLYLGNTTRVVARTPPPTPDARPSDTPTSVATNGTLLLDERVEVADAYARRGAKLRLLADVHGDLVVPEGAVQLSNRARVRGDLLARRDVIAGVSSRVDGAVAATDGAVKVVRLARLAGDVFAKTEFRGERDVVVGASGTTIDVVGSVVLRDRGEYFGTIEHEGPITMLGGVPPILHAPVVQVAHGTLAAPAMPDWRLDPVVVDDADPSADDRTIAAVPGGTLLPPGRYGAIVLAQEAVLRLAPGVYDVASFAAQSDAQVVVDVADPDARVELRVKKNVEPGRRFVVDVGAAGEAGRQARASRIRTVVGGSFRGGQDAIWAGAIVAKGGIALGKHTRLWGSLASGGDVAVGRDSTIVWVPPADPS